MKKLKKTVMIFIVMIAIALSFNGKYQSMIEELTSTGNSKQSSVNDYIMLSNSFLENMTIYGDEFFNKGGSRDSDYFNMLKYNPESNSYNLDDAGGTEYEKATGNLTGLGEIPKGGIKRDEMNFTFELNEYFKKFYNRLPGISWLYYTSENNFLLLYPWTSSKEFMFNENLKGAEFYEHVNPENNPQRKIMWTPIYLDHAGKGLMVTLSSPIYDKDTFKGVVCLDLTNNKFSELMNSEYESYLIDDMDCIIASSKNAESGKKVTKINDVLKIQDGDIKKMKEAQNNSVQRIGGYFTYTASFNDAPWKLLVLVPVYLIAGKSFLFTLPLIIICIFLIFAFNEVEFRRKTEKRLKNIADTDQLTGLKNRHYFDITVLETMKSSDKSDRPLSMIIFDLDYFKLINDNWGHPVGDEVLKQAAEIISRVIRSTDMIFRVGGEEFVVLLPDTDIIAAMATAEKLRKALDTNVHPVAGRCTASFGVGERLKNESFNIWYKKVDQALYTAKKEGRNRVVSSLEIDDFI